MRSIYSRGFAFYEPTMEGSTLSQVLRSFLRLLNGFSPLLPVFPDLENEKGGRENLEKSKRIPQPANSIEKKKPPFMSQMKKGGESIWW